MVLGAGIIFIADQISQILSNESTGIVFVHDRRRTKTGHFVLRPLACINLSTCVKHVHMCTQKSVILIDVNLHFQTVY